VNKSLRRATRSTVVIVGAACALAIVAMALFAGVLALYAPDEQNFDLIETRPSTHALFGTDRFGRDVLSRVIHGARVSLSVRRPSIRPARFSCRGLGDITCQGPPPQGRPLRACRRRLDLTGGPA
jgi:hypothetical protein